jgi:hypothetical protein
MMDVWRVAHGSNPLAQKTQACKSLSQIGQGSLIASECSSDQDTDDSDETLSDGDEPPTEASLVDALGIAHPVTSLKEETKEEPTEEELARRRAISDVGPRPNVMAAATPTKSPLPVLPMLPKTECHCVHSSSHYPNVALDSVFPGSIESLYNLLFNSSFISNFLIEGEKSQGTSCC